MDYKYKYEFNGEKVTLNEIEHLIIDDYINTDMTKNDIYLKYPISREKLALVLKNYKKSFVFKKCKKCDIIGDENFYENDKYLCKKCICESAKNKYGNWSIEEKKSYIAKAKLWQGKNLIRVRLLAAKDRAKKKNLEFDIDEEFILELLEKQNYKCKYSNMILDIENIGSNNSFLNNSTLSIDRIDSKKGYTKDNVVLATAIVNSMKNELSQSEFFNIIKAVFYANFS